MKTDFEYIRFVKKPSTGTTSVWSCKNIRHGDELGIIKWYGGWRTYCFFPTVQAVYSRGCLNDITEFIDTLLKNRREGE
jgi:hypothetical protein